MARAHHDTTQLLGTTAAGTLRLSTDSRGLWYEVDIPNTTAGRDVLALVERGDMSKSSFAFFTPKDGDNWSHTESGVVLRELVSVELVDVAPVAVPAYEATSVSARARGRVSARGAAPNRLYWQRLLLSWRENGMDADWRR
jgi:HK97 family phage prohead protease